MSQSPPVDRAQETAQGRSRPGVTLSLLLLVGACATTAADPAPGPGRSPAAWSEAGPDRGAPPSESEASARLPEALAVVPESAAIAGTAGPAQGSGEAFPQIHGQLYSRFRARSTDDADDYELVEVLSLDVGNPETDQLTGHFMGRGVFDLGGSGNDDLFFGLKDTFDSSVTGDLYYAYVDYRGFEALPMARLGRQQLADTPAIVTFDGLRLGTKAMGDARVEVGAYGGVPVHFYESSPAGDAVLGTYVQARPWQGGRVRADYMYLEDERSQGEFQNDLLSLELWQAIQQKLFLEAGYTWLESEDRDVRASARWYDASSDLMLQARYYQLLEPMNELVNELDPYSSSLLTYYPFRQFGLLAAKGLGEVAHLQLGLDLRRVEDEADVGEFNRDYDRGWTTLALHDLFETGFELSLTGDWWDGDGRDMNTLGFELGRALNASLDLSLGSYYALYKYDLFNSQERDDVRVWYLRGRWKRTASTTLDAVYEYENDELEDYHTLRLEALWRF